MFDDLGEKINEKTKGVIGPAAIGTLEREEADPLVADAAGTRAAGRGFDQVHLYVESGAAEGGERLATAEHVVTVFAGGSEGAEVDGEGRGL